MSISNKNGRNSSVSNEVIFGDTAVESDLQIGLSTDRYNNTKP